MPKMMVHLWFICGGGPVEVLGWGERAAQGRTRTGGGYKEERRRMNEWVWGGGGCITDSV
jgi:hypothetical protein